MFKKLIIASTVLAMSSSVVFANPHAKHHHVKKHVDFKNEQAVVAPVAVVSAPVAVESVAVPYVGVSAGVAKTGGYYGLVDNLFVGTGKALNNHHYLGAELSASVGSVALSGNQYHNRSTYGLGASILPGVILNKDAMLYARVGVQALHERVRSATHTGGQLGLGLQTVLNPNWDVRGEYAYTGQGIIRNFTKHGTNQVNLGLVYKLA